MKMTDKTDDRLRTVLQTTIGLVSAVFWAAKVIALSFAVTWATFIIAALYMADPETATFRDFLLMIQSPNIGSMVFIASCLVSGVFFMFGAAGKSQPATTKGAMAKASDTKAEH